MSTYTVSWSIVVESTTGADALASAGRAMSAGVVRASVAETPRRRAHILTRSEPWCDAVHRRALLTEATMDTGRREWCPLCQKVREDVAPGSLAW